MENKLEKNKCQNCPMKSQRPDLLKTITVSGLNPSEYKTIMYEINATIQIMRDLGYDNQKKIKVTSS